MKNLLLFSICLILLFWGGCKSSSDRDTRSGQIVLQHQLRSKVEVLDPANIGDSMSHAVGAEIFECLYRYHYLKRPYAIIPELAADMPAVSEDGLKYTIPIKSGVYFHDDECFAGGKGREVTAADFVYSWKRMADIKSRSKMWWVLDNKIVGLDEFREYTKTCKTAEEVDYSVPVEGLQTPDPYTLVIRLKKPWPQVMHVLAYLPTAAVAREAAEYYGKDIINHPVGTGPFMLKVWNRSSYIEMVRNPNYRVDLYPSEGESGDFERGLLADAGKPMPFVDRIIWRVVIEDQPRWLMFLQGDIDITSIPKDNFGQAMATPAQLTPDMSGRNIRFDSFQEPDTFWVGFNNEDALLGKNKALRLAISCAFDRERWIELFFNGRGIVAHGYIPPNMPGYDPNIKYVSKTEYNQDKAKKYLSEAERLHGGPLPTLRLAISGTDTTYRQMGQFLESSMEGIGLDIEVDYFDWPTYLEKLKTKSLGLYSSGWIADYPDVENFMQVFYSRNSPWPNSSNYSNREFDRIYEQVSVMADSPERTELYRKAERIVVEDAPVAFMYHRIWYTMYHDWVGNFKPDAYRSESCGYGLSKFYRIDPEKRRAYRAKYK